jgi:prevent-host-death family protein
MAKQGKVVRKPRASARRKALPRGSRIEINVYQAKTHFSEILRRVESGDEVTIARDGAPVVRLQKVTQASKPRRWGQDKGKVVLARDFDALGPEWDEYVK